MLRKSYMFHRRPDSSCALGSFSRKMLASPRDADLSAKPLHEVVGNLALFLASAIAVSCPLGPPEICLLENVQVCFSPPFLLFLLYRAYPLIQSLRQIWLVIIPYSLKLCLQPAPVITAGPGCSHLHSRLFHLISFL